MVYIVAMALRLMEDNYSVWHRLRLGRKRSRYLTPLSHLMVCVHENLHVDINLCRIAVSLPAFRLDNPSSLSLHNYF